MPEQNNGTQRFSVDLGHVKTMFDLGWKLIAVLWFAFRLYSNEGALLKSSKELEARVSDMQTQMNKQDRDQVEIKGKIDSLQTQFNLQREFESATRTKR